MVKLVDINNSGSNTVRKEALNIFKELGIPNAKVEEWKYTKPKNLQAEDFVLESFPSPSFVSDCDIEAYKIEFFNGCIESVSEELKDKIFIENIASQEKISLADYEKKHPFVLLNSALYKDGIFLFVSKNTQLAKPIAIIYKTSSQDKNLLSNIRNVFVLENGAEATILEYFCYFGDVKSVYFNNIVNEVYVGNNAHLKHYKLQDESFKSNHVAFNHVSVMGGGSYKAVALQKGADLSRNETKVLLTEESASAEVDSAYIMNGWATIDTTTDVLHLSPHTFSNQLVKGVVGGEAKGVFQGKIHIAKDAIKAEGNQLHRALLLSDMAEVDCKPELEIFADDVKCSHGAATGVLDEMQLFYMCSRGISRNEAKQMLIDAYLDDVLNKISNNDIYNLFKNKIK